MYGHGDRAGCKPTGSHQVMAVLKGRVPRQKEAWFLRSKTGEDPRWSKSSSSVLLSASATAEQRRQGTMWEERKGFNPVFPNLCLVSFTAGVTSDSSTAMRYSMLAWSRWHEDETSNRCPAAACLPGCISLFLSPTGRGESWWEVQPPSPGRTLWRTAIQQEQLPCTAGLLGKGGCVCWIWVGFFSLSQKGEEFLS